MGITVQPLLTFTDQERVAVASSLGKPGMANPQQLHDFIKDACTQKLELLTNGITDPAAEYEHARALLNSVQPIPGSDPGKPAYQGAITITKGGPTSIEIRGEDGTLKSVPLTDEIRADIAGKSPQPETPALTPSEKAPKEPKPETPAQKSAVAPIDTPSNKEETEPPKEGEQASDDKPSEDQQQEKVQGSETTEQQDAAKLAQTSVDNSPKDQAAVAGEMADNLKKKDSK